MFEDREQVSICDRAPPVNRMRGVFLMIHVHPAYVRDMRHQVDYALDAPNVMPAGSCIQSQVTSEEMDEEKPLVYYMAFQSEVYREGEGW